jgi:plastocyanin
MKLLAIALVLATSVTVAHAASRPPARLQVVAREYSYTLSHLRLHSGPALIELDDFGQDRHDLRVQRLGARHIAGLREIGPGERATLALSLPPGRYSFWCSVADHRARGMRATLTVTR